MQSKKKKKATQSKEKATVQTHSKGSSWHGSSAMPSIKEKAAGRETSNAKQLLKEKEEKPTHSKK